MKKVYSKRIGTEVFALAPEQLDVFKKAGYKTPTPEEVIADAGAAFVTPPENKRAYVVFNFQKGEFAVRVKGCTLKGEETPAFVGELVQAALIKRLAENADPDRPKAVKPEGATPGGSPLAEMLKATLVKAFQSSANQPGAADKPAKVDAPPAESEEVVE